MNYTFKTKCHPEAGGRHPVEGDVEYSVIFPTDEGGTVTVRMGRRARDSFADLLRVWREEELRGLAEANGCEYGLGDGT